MLDDLEVLFGRNGSRMRDYNLPQKTFPSDHVQGNRLIQDELAYGINDLICESENHISSLNADQMCAFKTITQTVSGGLPGFFFLSLDMVEPVKLVCGMLSLHLFELRKKLYSQLLRLEWLRYYYLEVEQLIHDLKSLVT